MRVTIIPGLGQGERIREIREDGNKLLLDVAGRPAILWQLDFVLPDICIVACHPDRAAAVRMTVGTSAWVIPYIAHDEPWGLAKFMQDAVRHMAPDVTTTLLFADTILSPGTDYTSLTVPGTVVVAPVPDRGRFLAVEVEGDKIVRWVDHPYDRRPGLATVGIYTAPAKDWSDALNYPDEENVAFKFIERIPFVPIETGAWLDVGTVESYRETCARLASCV